MSLVTIKVLRTERIEDDLPWEYDRHALLVRYAGRSDTFNYSTGLAHEGYVNPSDWLENVALDVQTANDGLDEYAAAYGESVEDSRDDFANIECYANRVKRLFGDDVDDLNGWACEERRVNLRIREGQEVSFDLVAPVYQQQLFRM